MVELDTSGAGVRHGRHASQAVPGQANLWLLSDGNLAESDGKRRTRPLSARSPRHAEQLDAFAAELVRARCRLHTDLALCDQCVGERQLDSLGFPSVTVAKGRGRYRLCPDCRKLFSVAEWHGAAVVRENGSTAFGGMCRGCSGEEPAA